VSTEQLSFWDDAEPAEPLTWCPGTIEQDGQTLYYAGGLKEGQPRYAPRPDLEDKPENYFIMSYILSAVNGQTKLEIVQEDNRPNATQEEPQGAENPMLQSLKKIAESLELKKT